MSVVDLGPVVRRVDVRRTPADAFRLFTEQMSAWWPLKSHSRAKDAAGEVTQRVDFEARVGGRIFETLNTGEQRDWGEVLAYEPGRRVVFSFQFGPAAREVRRSGGAVRSAGFSVLPRDADAFALGAHGRRGGAGAWSLRLRMGRGVRPAVRRICGTGSPTLELKR